MCHFKQKKLSKESRHLNVLKLKLQHMTKTPAPLWWLCLRANNLGICWSLTRSVMHIYTSWWCNIFITIFFKSPLTIFNNMALVEVVYSKKTPFIHTVLPTYKVTPIYIPNNFVYTIKESAQKQPSFSRWWRLVPSGPVWCSRRRGPWQLSWAPPWECRRSPASWTACPRPACCRQHHDRASHGGHDNSLRSYCHWSLFISNMVKYSSQFEKIWNATKTQIKTTQ